MDRKSSSGSWKTANVEWGMLELDRNGPVGGLEVRTEAGLGCGRSTDRSVLFPNKSVRVPGKEPWIVFTVTTHALYRRVHRKVRGDVRVKEKEWAVPKHRGNIRALFSNLARNRVRPPTRSIAKVRRVLALSSARWVPYICIQGAKYRLTRICI